MIDPGGIPRRAEGELETYRASSLPTRTRAAAWNALYSSRINQADLTPADRDSFEAELRLGNLGPIGVVRMTCGRSFIDRTPRHIARASGRTYTFILQVQGSGVFAHYGHEALLQKGDFTLCDSAAPHSYRVEQSSEVVMLRVPSNILKEHLPSPECFCGRQLRASEGLTSTVAALTLNLCEQLESGLSLDFHPRVARPLLEMIATSYSVAFRSLIRDSSVLSGRHAKVKLYIEQHLHDPELSPCRVASGLKLSPRYLRMIFAVGRETVSAYILRRRLEECARQMCDPRWRGHSISEIAFGWGFNSAPHFTRSFRERFKISPRDYRRLGPSAGANPDRLHIDELANTRGAELAAVAG
jgi:AraC family transcriptional activator of tynA and feaB